IALCDQASAQRDVYFSVRSTLADVVDEDASPLQDLGIELLIAALVCAEGGDVRSRCYPLIHDDRATRRRHRDDHVSAPHDLGQLGGSFELRLGEFELLGGDEMV